ncbi:MAG: HEAT repeat domain-containing protein [Desulfobulbaceae bacterium]|nr:HEAT repeat domain-containing protein [Desulfobulbaceae bacterium]
MTERQIKKQLAKIIHDDDFEQIGQTVNEWPVRFTISPLLSLIYQVDEVVKYRAIVLLGRVMNKLAAEDMEAARVVMRRILWSLNEESGGIGWGMPEALGEIMAMNRPLAEEYGHMLVAYMREESYLELPPLQRGLMWGIGRLAGVYPQKILDFLGDGHMQMYLESTDLEVVALASRNFGILKTPEAAHWIRKFCDEEKEVRIFEDGVFVDTTVGKLAQQAVARIET